MAQKSKLAKLTWKYWIWFPVCIVLGLWWMLTLDELLVSWLPETPGWFGSSIEFLSGLMGWFLIVLPLIMWTINRKTLSQEGIICGRCEKDITEGETVARYEGEMVCVACAEHLECIEERELPRFQHGGPDDQASP